MINKETGFNSDTIYPRNVLLETQIGQFFDVVAERQFQEKLKQREVDEGQRIFYSREQVLKFLLEFAAGVKKTQIIYELKPNGKVIYPAAGLEIETMLFEAVQKQGLNADNRRELAELQGWQKMQNLFQIEGVNHVLQLSPPDQTNLHHGHYGFLFWYERKGNQVINHILRYDEDPAQLIFSSQLASILEIPIANQPNLAQSLLVEPKGFRTDPLTINTLLEGLGLVLDNKGSLLEQALLTDPAFRRLLASYQHLLDQPKFDNFQKAQVLTILSQLYQLTQNKAAQIGLLDKHPQEMCIPLIFKGGSCPVIGLGFGFHDWAGFLFGEPFTCPSCGFVSYVPVGNHCPNCHITKEEWRKKKEEETGDSFNLCD